MEVVMTPPWRRDGTAMAPQGQGQFYPPDPRVFETAYIRNYDEGAKRKQECEAGTQKVTKRKCRETDPRGFLLVYSLGDEMYKWCRPAANHEPFRSKLHETYSFPVGWGRKVRNFQEHLVDFNQNGFNGSDALSAALKWQTRAETEETQKRDHLQRQAAFIQHHAAKVSTRSSANRSG